MVSIAPVKQQRTAEPALAITVPSCIFLRHHGIPKVRTTVRQQHEAYNQALRNMAVEVIELPEQADLADSVFVEEVALLFDEVAIITHPGAISRRPEKSSIAEALEPHRPLSYIKGTGNSGWW